MYEQILYEVADPIAAITLNRPKTLNAWTARMGAEVKHALARAEEDKRAVAILLTGAGRGFCSGADLGRLRGISEGRSEEEPPPELEADPGDPALGEDLRGTYNYLMSIRKPIIAAINGPVAGMAIPIALACDLRFASDRAIFTTAFSRRGLVAEWGIGWLLEYIEDLATHCSPASMAIIKRQVYQHLGGRLGPAERESVQLMFESFERPDQREGVISFLEKRPPKFERI
jgi:enoyl-CoA hydratase/carnithine racemase